MAEIKPKSARDYGLSMTESAAARIRALAADEQEPVSLRVQVMGGGCSGFQYGFSLDRTRDPADMALERDGARVLIDEMSVALLQGSQIDWHEDVAGAMFVITNPNATASCGCGPSFSIG